MTLSITVCIPSIPGRERNRQKAINTVMHQTVLDNVELLVDVDTEYEGPAVVRNRLARKADTEFLLWLDDDDLLEPTYIEHVSACQQEYNSDVTWPWFTVRGGSDPFPQNFGKQWDPESPHIFPITTLVRRESFMDVGGFDDGTASQPDPNDPSRIVAGEDWRLWLALSEAGARFRHLPERHWIWVHHLKNSSGLPDRARGLYA